MSKFIFDKRGFCHFRSFSICFLSQFQNVLAHLVKKLFFQRQTIFDASTVIFLEKTAKNHVSGHRPPYQSQLALFYELIM
ncbi:MAG: hypothetical protein MR727_02840 [Lentisphaeria bacterium]|nr:hypothetical protein [Lentisphaeria bacterium]